MSNIKTGALAVRGHENFRPVRKPSASSAVSFRNYRHPSPPIRLALRGAQDA